MVHTENISSSNTESDPVGHGPVLSSKRLRRCHHVHLKVTGSQLLLLSLSECAVLTEAGLWEALCLAGPFLETLSHCSHHETDCKLLTSICCPLPLRPCAQTSLHAGSKTWGSSYAFKWFMSHFAQYDVWSYWSFLSLRRSAKCFLKATPRAWEDGHTLNTCKFTLFCSVCVCTY